MRLLILLTITLFYFACKNNTTPGVSNADHGALKQRLIDSFERVDSIQNERDIDSLLGIAASHYHDRSFQRREERYTIQIGNILSPRKRHAYIKINMYHGDAPGMEYRMKIVDLDKPGFPALMDTLVFLDGLVHDTVYDVNGDMPGDFFYINYSGTGCCRRNFHNVWLYDEKGDSLHHVDIMNATFYPKEKVVRGVFYGHPGEVPLYKFKWNKFSLDTVEVIFPLPGKPGYFLKSPVYDRSLGTRIKGLPKEYLTINDFDWFTWYPEYQP